MLGASGGVGREVVRQARERGHDLRVLLREGTTTTSLDAVDIQFGNVLHQDAVDRLTEGRDAIVVCLGIRRQSASPWSALVSPPDLVFRAMENVVRAMGRFSVRRVVAISAAGVRDSLPSVHFAMRTLIRNSNLAVAYRDLERMEAMLEASDLDWMAVRPVTLTNGGRPERPVCTARYGLLSTISRAAVARFMLDAVEAQTLFARTPMIAGSVEGVPC